MNLNPVKQQNHEDSIQRIVAASSAIKLEVEKTSVTAPPIQRLQSDFPTASDGSADARESADGSTQQTEPSSTSPPRDAHTDGELRVQSTSATTRSLNECRGSQSETSAAGTNWRFNSSTYAKPSIDKQQSPFGSAEGRSNYEQSVSPTSDGRTKLPSTINRATDEQQEWHSLSPTSRQSADEREQTTTATTAATRATNVARFERCTENQSVSQPSKGYANGSRTEPATSLAGSNNDEQFQFSTSTARSINDGWKQSSVSSTKYIHEQSFQWTTSGHSNEEQSEPCSSLTSPAGNGGSESCSSVAGSTRPRRSQLLSSTTGSSNDDESILHSDSTTESANGRSVPLISTSGAVRGGHTNGQPAVLRCGRSFGNQEPESIVLETRFIKGSGSATITGTTPLANDKHLRKESSNGEAYDKNSTLELPTNESAILCVTTETKSTSISQQDTSGTTPSTSFNGHRRVVGPRPTSVESVGRESLSFGPMVGADPSSVKTVTTGCSSSINEHASMVLDGFPGSAGEKSWQCQDGRQTKQHGSGESEAVATIEAPRGILAIDKAAVHKICSGQVVVNLSTAVKELVENSLDAGSTSVEVRLTGYGATTITVIDDGPGLMPKDFEALTLKHHTSKLRDFNGLSEVATFGFRGEALSSLCALSRLSVCTRHASQTVGTMLTYEHNGNIASQKPMSRQVGTTVTLSNLFSTLPVRKQEFDRNLKREYHKMMQVLHSYCIIATNVRIQCSNQAEASGSRRNIVVATSGSGSVRDNFSALFGAKQANMLLQFVQCTATQEQLHEYKINNDADTEAFIVEGLISSCAHGSGRSAPDRQFYYINNRPCDPAKVSRVVNEVYHAYNRNQYPVVVLNMMTAHSTVDVNLTPDKRQVLLHNERLLLATLKSSLHHLYENIPNTMTVNTKLISSQSTPFSSQRDFASLASQASPQPKISSLLTSSPNSSHKPVHSSQSALHSPSLSTCTQSQPQVCSPLAKSFSSPGTSKLNCPQSKSNISKSFSLHTQTTLKSSQSPLAARLARFSAPSPLPLTPNNNDNNGNTNNSGDNNTCSRKRPAESSDDAEGSKIKQPRVDTALGSGNNADNFLMQEHEDAKILINGYKEPEDDHLLQKEDFSQTQVATVLGCAEIFEEDGTSNVVSSDESETLIKLKNITNINSSFSRRNLKAHYETNAFLDKLLAKKSNGSKKEDLQNGEDNKDIDDALQAFNNDYNNDDVEFIFDNIVTNNTTNTIENGEMDCHNVDHPPTNEFESYKSDDEDVSIEYDECPVISRQKRKKKTVAFDISALRRQLAGRRRRSSDAGHEANKNISRNFRAKIAPSDNQAAEDELNKVLAKDMFAKMKILGQFNLGFILTQLKSDLFIIDQHASDEKYNYEMLQKTCILKNQPLIVPQLLELTPGNESILQDNLDIFTANGFVFDIDDTKTLGQRVKLKSAPQSRNWCFGKDDIDELIFMLSDSPGLMCRPSRVQSMFASRACRKSVMVGNALSAARMRELVDHMGEIEQPWNCPHGRPTVRHLVNLDMLAPSIK